MACKEHVLWPRHATPQPSRLSDSIVCETETEVTLNSFRFSQLATHRQTDRQIHLGSPWMNWQK